MSNGKIVGPSGASQQPSADPKKPKQAERSGTFVPSDEFRAFWGNNQNPSWFQKRRFVSVFTVLVGVMFVLILYLCSQLLFTPEELLGIINSKDKEALEQEARIKHVIERREAQSPNDAATTPPSTEVPTQQ